MRKKGRRAVLEFLLEKAVEAGTRCVIKNVVFGAADALVPGLGTGLRTADKAFRVMNAIGGDLEFDEALDNAGGFIDNLIYP